MTKEETRDYIINVATRLFAKEGFADTSMNTIVAETGLSKGGIYWHFKSKDEIIEAVYAQFFEAQNAFVEMMLQADGTVSERLMALARMAGDDLYEAPQFPHPLELYSYALRHKPLMDAITNHFARYLKHLTALIQHGIDRGEFVDCVAEDAALILVSTLDGMVLTAVSYVSEENLSKKFELAISILLQGLQKHE